MAARWRPRHSVGPGDHEISGVTRLGLSFLLLMAAEEIAHLVYRTPPASAGEAASVVRDTATSSASVAPEAAAHLIYSDWHMFWLGCVIFALLHVRVFREAVLLILKSSWKLARGVLIDFPWMVAAVAGRSSGACKAFPMLLFRRFVLGPAFLATAVFWGLLPAVGDYASAAQSLVGAGNLRRGARASCSTSRFSRDTAGIVGKRVYAYGRIRFACTSWQGAVHLHSSTPHSLVDGWPGTTALRRVIEWRAFAAASRG